MESLTGKLLVAIPDMADSNFFRSVVFIIEHNASGAMGVILNRPTNENIADFWQGYDAAVTVFQTGNVHLGGPVEGPVFALHNQFCLSDENVIDGVYLAAINERLNQLVSSPEQIKFRVFNSYSGWGPGQLEMELKAGGWLVADTTADDVFREPDNLWKSICERVGNDVISPGIPKFPAGGQPGLN